MNRDLKTLLEVSDFIPFATHENAPFIAILDVLQTTAKAVKVRHEKTRYTVWIPKSALKPIKFGAFTLADWYRKKLQKDEVNHVFRALDYI